MESLIEFISTNPDPRELKRALAVKMVRQNYGYYQIRDTLGVSVGFISKYLQKFEADGIEGLKLKHKGSQGYLTSEQKQATLEWLHRKNYWQLSELQTYSENWKITCIRFAPNAPEQNPIEDVWLKAKRFVREFYSLCSSFAIAKRLFELATEHQIFDFPKLSLYGSFS